MVTTRGSRRTGGRRSGSWKALVRFSHASFEFCEASEDF
jgi:hypothetical protein